MVILICGGLCALILGWVVLRRLRATRDLEENSVEPEELDVLLKAKQVLLYDVRQPLDFLAYPHIIPGATRIAPKDVSVHTASFSRDQDSVIYCTGAHDDTSKMILRKASALNFTHVKLLKGGLAAWKAKGYPVEAYSQPFELDKAIHTS